MKLFISTPMHGLTDDEIKETFKRIRIKAAEFFKDENIATQSVVSNALFGRNCKGKSRVQMLGNSISLLDTVDAIIFTKGFSQARGCMIEYYTVDKYADDWHNIRILFETDKGLKEAKNFHERFKYVNKDRFYAENKEDEE